MLNNSRGSYAIAIFGPHHLMHTARRMTNVIHNPSGHL